MKTVHFFANKDQIINYFLTPVRINKKELEERGYKVKIFYNLTKQCLSCDILCLLSKPTLVVLKEGCSVCEEGGPVIRFLQKAREYASKIIWFDDSDSTTVTHYELLDYVDLYLKKQLLKDKSFYSIDYYGGRIFSHYYHEKYQVEDKNQFQQFYPLKKEYYSKVDLSWNIGLGDMCDAFSWKNNLKRRFPMLCKNPYDIFFIMPDKIRSVDLFLRISINLSRETIAIHRKLMVDKLMSILDRNNKITGIVGDKYQADVDNDDKSLFEVNGKLKFKSYRKIFGNTKISPSPFGWGELGIRDYEAFIFGAMLLKPDISHMSTWPDIFIPNKTYKPVQWDFSDMESVIIELLENQNELLEIAVQGQDAYKASISKAGMESFCNWFSIQLER